MHTHPIGILLFSFRFSHFRIFAFCIFNSLEVFPFIQTLPIHAECLLCSRAMARNVIEMFSYLCTICTFHPSELKMLDFMFHFLLAPPSEFLSCCHTCFVSTSLFSPFSPATLLPGPLQIHHNSSLINNKIVARNASIGFIPYTRIIIYNRSVRLLRCRTHFDKHIRRMIVSPECCVHPAHTIPHGAASCSRLAAFVQL